MKKLLVILVMVCGILSVAVLTGCKSQFVKESSFRRSGSTSERSGGKQSLSLVCWNVQTFFDAVTTGNEYQEFKNSERWTKEKYVKRLNKLCEIMTNLNPDIFVMEEVENTEVVQYIANTLAVGSWEHKKNWQYTCFTKELGSAIGCAVFSRYEISELKTHALDIRTQETSQPSSRPLMQLTVNIGNRELELFVNHWKSKSGGEMETEIWRDWQELVLAERTTDLIKEMQAPLIVMCGDFNRSAEDFVIEAAGGKTTNTVLRGNSETVKVWSPWFNSAGKLSSENGSYYYNGEWERIDNILLLGNLEMTSFSAVRDSPVADEEGIPVSYKVYTGEGYSDHLPLKCVISF